MTFEGTLVVNLEGILVGNNDVSLPRVEENHGGGEVEHSAENMYNPPQILTQPLQRQSPTRSPSSGLSCKGS